jgi:hypothetical protein
LLILTCRPFTKEKSLNPGNKLFGLILEALKVVLWELFYLRVSQ